MPAEVTITELGPGRHLVTISGQKVDAVRSVTVRKDVGAAHDIVTLEVVSQRTTVTPAVVADPFTALDEADAALDARMASGGTVRP